MLKAIFLQQKDHKQIDTPEEKVSKIFKPSLGKKNYPFWEWLAENH